MQISKPTYFEIITEKDESVDVKIIGPDLKSVPIKIQKGNGNRVYVKYKPVIPGKHLISVKYGKNPMKNVPFIVNAFSNDKCDENNLKKDTKSVEEVMFDIKFTFFSLLF